MAEVFFGYSGRCASASRPQRPKYSRAKIYFWGFNKRRRAKLPGGASCRDHRAFLRKRGKMPLTLPAFHFTNLSPILLVSRPEPAPARNFPLKSGASDEPRQPPLRFRNHAPGLARLDVMRKPDRCFCLRSDGRFVRFFADFSAPICSPTRMTLRMSANWGRPEVSGVRST
jgi:hypothetical protein